MKKTMILLVSLLVIFVIGRSLLKVPAVQDSLLELGTTRIAEREPPCDDQLLPVRKRAVAHHYPALPAACRLGQETTSRAQTGIPKMKNRGCDSWTGALTPGAGRPTRCHSSARGAAR